MSYPSVPARRQLAAGVALLGCVLASTAESHAAIITLDLGPSGFNVLGVNAGIASGTTNSRINFPDFGPTLQIYNNFPGYFGVLTGLDGSGGLQIAITGGSASPRNFAAGATIDGSHHWSDIVTETVFRHDSAVSANFNAGSFLGFRFTTDLGFNWNYGWLEVTWDGTDFEILSGAYESTANLAIMTPAGGGGVPLPGAAGLAACGLLAAARRRRR